MKLTISINCRKHDAKPVKDSEKYNKNELISIFKIFIVITKYFQHDYAYLFRFKCAAESNFVCVCSIWRLYNV